jgi:hypothetical protein
VTDRATASGDRAARAWCLENDDGIVASVRAGKLAVFLALLAVECIVAVAVAVVWGTNPSFDRFYFITVFGVLGVVLLASVPWLCFGRIEVKVTQTRLSVRRVMGPLRWGSGMPVSEVAYVKRVDREYVDRNTPHSSTLSIVGRSRTISFGRSLDQPEIGCLWTTLAARFRPVHRVEAVEHLGDTD